MACDPSSCQSNCYKSEQVKEEPVATKGISKCVKCKSNEGFSFEEGQGKLCGDCFKSNLFAKFRLTVTSHAMITPSDKLLVAFSGGPSSRVALQFVHEMQYRAQKNYDASKDRSLAVFGVGVAFVNESLAYPTLSDQINNAVEEIRMIVSDLGPPIKELHVVPIESIFGTDSVDRHDRLKRLLDAVSDATGKEDLLLHLRMLSLQKFASEHGYNRLVLGSCTSRIACHVLSATVKGQGFSLPADIQYVDARWGVPVVLPLRDCPAQEINRFCSLDGLKTINLASGSSSSINGLISSFVALLQKENPSRESTIMRTAGKLTPFHFNKIPEISDSNVPLATRRRQKRLNIKHNGFVSSDSFCPMCNGPLNKNEGADHFSSSPENFRESVEFANTCCSSCWFQILPKDPSLIQGFYSLLPQSLVARNRHGESDRLTALREKIQDCLLSDSDDEI